MIGEPQGPRAINGKIRVSPYLRWKVILDRAVAAFLLLPGIPMIGFLVLLVRLTSRGPGIYRQKRVGKNGVIYTMLKLRSMRIDAESNSGPVWSPTGNDPRVTGIGYWLRKLHLDELPQLFNVIRGEMSLMGPRPERPEFVRVLADSIPGYMDRLAVLPGITGLAQINLPPDSDLNSVRRKLMLDLEYIETATFWLDFRMFLSTFFRMIGLTGELAMKMMCLQREVTLPEAESRANGPIIPPMQSIGEVTPDTIAAEIESHASEPSGAQGNAQESSRHRRDKRRPEDSGILASAVNR